MPKHPCIEFSLCALAIVGPIAVIFCRFRFHKRIEKNGSVETRPLGIGVRVIQLIALLVLAPVIGILGLEGVLNGEGTGALLGAMVGFALGGIPNPVPKR